jgi:hypothetical protein
MLTAPLLALLLAFPVPPAPSSLHEPACRELSDSEIAERIDAFLRSIDVPIGPDDWLALGPRAAAPLEGIARDRSALPTRRAKALSALALIAGSSAAGTLAELASAEGEPVAVRLAAVRGIAQAAPPDGLVDAMRPILDGAGDVRVRATAARQLADRASARGCAHVLERAGAEDEIGRALFRPAVESCRRAAAKGP